MGTGNWGQPLVLCALVMVGDFFRIQPWGSKIKGEIDGMAMKRGQGRKGTRFYLKL